MAEQPVTFLAAAPELPELQLEVDHTQPAERAALQDGFSLEQSRYTLSDGSRYDVQQFHPYRQRYDIAATYTTPWCTDLKGFNQLAGTALAQKGMPVVAVSPERIHMRDMPSRMSNTW
jgi:hypothetical protein